MFCEADYAMETPNPDIQTQSSSPMLKFLSAAIEFFEVGGLDG